MGLGIEDSGCRSSGYEVSPARKKCVRAGLGFGLSDHVDNWIRKARLFVAFFQGSGFKILGLGFGVWGVVFGVWCLVFGV